MGRLREFVMWVVGVVDLVAFEVGFLTGLPVKVDGAGRVDGACYVGWRCGGDGVGKVNPERRMEAETFLAVSTAITT